MTKIWIYNVARSNLFNFTASWWHKNLRVRLNVNIFRPHQKQRHYPPCIIRPTTFQLNKLHSKVVYIENLIFPHFTIKWPKIIFPFNLNHFSSASMLSPCCHCCLVYLVTDSRQNKLHSSWWDTFSREEHNWWLDNADEATENTLKFSWRSQRWVKCVVMRDGFLEWKFLN